LEEFYEAQFNEELTPDDQSSTTAKLSAREIESNLTSTKNPEYQPGTWVRVLRVPYKGDLAQVISYDTNENDILLKLIPRIDYDRPRGAFRTTLSDAEAKKRRKIQHKPQLFDQKEIERNGGSCTTDGDTITFEGKCYRSGFLIAKFPSTQVRSENPSLAEIENFLHPNEPFKSQPTGKSTTVPDFMAPSSSNQPREGGRSGGQTFNRAQGIYKGKVATIKVNKICPFNLIFTQFYVIFITNTVYSACQGLQLTWILLLETGRFPLVPPTFMFPLRKTTLLNLTHKAL